MRVLILANGDPPSVAMARRAAQQADLRIVTDGAAHTAEELGIRPDLLCGDFDSVHIETARRAFPDMEIVPTPTQEFADLEKAITIARERGATAIAILGATGGRIDHTLSSFALLLRYAPALPLRLLDDRSVTWAVPGAATSHFAAGPEETVSLVTFTGATVSIEGVRWPLAAFPLLPGTHGVSNIAAAAEVIVRVENGSVFVTHFTSNPVPFDTDSFRQDVR